MRSFTMLKPAAGRVILVCTFVAALPAGYLFHQFLVPEAPHKVWASLAAKCIADFVAVNAIESEYSTLVADFLDRHETVLIAAFRAGEKAESASYDELFSVVQSCFDAESCNEIRVDPTKAKYPILLYPEYDNTRQMVFVDAADWPEFFPPNRFGPGVGNAMKAVVHDLLVKDGLIGTL